ncbi:hypothetical protein BKA91DRAFT_133733 [Yarrowia lipolytica]|nr:hypothetical protein BKA91DRAFT_133733 [Yarrowia lipolytica]KAE8169293.1 hypothetical protein BKA90DRAFT_142900 [Yarrowia lipolytica]RMJ00908.1 hypothetical protein BD777DRAFT_121479 [Yarrowia lipolytica]
MIRKNMENPFRTFAHINSFCHAVVILHVWTHALFTCARVVSVGGSASGISMMISGSHSFLVQGLESVKEVYCIVLVPPWRGVLATGLSYHTNPVLYCASSTVLVRYPCGWRLAFRR